MLIESLIEEKNDLYTVPLFDKNQGDTIRIYNLNITLPKVGAKKNILFARNKKQDQKWKRIEPPKGLLDRIEAEYTEEDIAFIEADFDRRINGVWMMINGELIYITGLHYYYIQWCKIDIGYPQYRSRDRKFFIYWEACVVDDACLGMIMVKHRREGATFKGAAIILEYITRNKRVNGGLISKTGTDAKEFFYKLVKMFRDLPGFYQPMIAGTDNPKTILEFDKPGERITKLTQKVQTSEALESKVEWKNTAENSFDSYKLARYCCDEGGKWEEADVSKSWGVVRPTLSGDILGKAFFPSTVNEMTRKGGKNYKKIWDGSDPAHRDGNGRTVSGMYRYFTPAYDGLEYENMIFIDEYGNSVIDTPDTPVMGINGKLIKMGSKQFLLNIRESLKNDTNALAEHKRQFPFEPEEAFRIEAGECSFDAERLYQQREWNDLYAGRLITRGNFIWVNDFGGKVRFVPSKSGRWVVAWLPDEADQNKMVMRYGDFFPGNIDWIVSGCDPYDHSSTTDGRRSNGASFVFRMYNPVVADSNMFVSQYIYRPPTVFQFYEDVLRQSIFYGNQVLAENNRIGLINWFTEHGFSNYLMKRPESTHTSSSKTQKSLGIPTSGDTVRDSLISSIEAYIVDNCGMDDDGNGGKVYFNELIEDWLRFDPNAWKEYDATVAAGLTLLATKKVIVQPKPMQNVLITRVYNNQGLRSKRIK